VIALKNAHDLVKDILERIDTNQDGRISYEGQLAKGGFPDADETRVSHFCKAHGR
jgi:hypothetical protein